MWFPEWIYTIDILFAVFVVFFVVSGTKHGLSGELAHLVMLVALLAGFCFFYLQLTQFASDYWRMLPPVAVRILVPVVILLLAVLIFVLARAVFKQILKDKLGEAADKVAGGVVGAVRGVLMGLAAFAALSMIPNDSLYQTLSEKSSIGGWVCNTLTPWIQPRIMDLPVLKNVEKTIE
jgi:uncharacterized membrane protein required for colicin V production